MASNAANKLDTVFYILILNSRGSTLIDLCFRKDFFHYKLQHAILGHNLKLMTIILFFYCKMFLRMLSVVW